MPWSSLRVAVEETVQRVPNRAYQELVHVLAKPTEARGKSVCGVQSKEGIGTGEIRANCQEGAIR